MEQLDQQKPQTGKQPESGHDAGHVGTGGHGGMAQRGVTRPMAEHTGHGDHAGHHEMTEAQRLEMLHMHHMQTLWVYWTIILLGIWVMLSPLTFDYTTGTVAPSGGRDVWLSLPARSTAMWWSDLISGFLLVIFGWRSLRPNRPVSLWVCCAVGIWLNLAPLIFWAPTAVAYLNDTLVGALVIALTVLVPGMPNMIMYMQWAAHIHHLGGALIIVVAVVAMGEVLRAGRYLNVLLGLGVAVLPWFLDGSTLPGQMSGLIVGLLTAGLSLSRGAKTEQYGHWDKYVV